MMNETSVAASLGSGCSTSPHDKINLQPSPPSSKIKQLSSNLAKVIQLFENHRDGTLEQSWTVIKLNADDFEQLSVLLERREPLFDYVNDKVRFDYDRGAQTLVIRMASKVHDLLASYIQTDIWCQLCLIMKGNDSNAELAKGIDPENSAEMVWNDGSIRKPDVRFRHANDVQPAVIIEIANTQQQKNLATLADQYIVRTSGAVNAVIGIKLDYRATLKAQISIWRPEYVMEGGQEYLISQQAIASEVFRREDGTAVTRKSLTLRLTDFIRCGLPLNVNDDQPTITISYAKMADYLNKAEGRPHTMISAQRMMPSLKPGAIEREREQSPPEELRP